MSAIEPYLHRTNTAYFTMEIGILPEMHSYSGGLGVLAGDAARSAADLKLPMVFVTLASRQGYLRQDLDQDGRQSAVPDPWDPAKWATPLDATVAVVIEGRRVWIQAFLYELVSPAGGRIPVIFLDTDLERNENGDRALTDRLYGGGDADRLKQEIVLGIGGEAMLRALGFAIRTYHMNEGHAALLTLSLLHRCRFNWDAVRERCVFTTHTPVAAGHDRFAWEDVTRILGNYVSIEALKALSEPENLNMTHLALTLSRYVNGVSRKHGEVSQAMFPDHPVSFVTNGVHPGQWVHPAMARLYDGLAPHWRQEPEGLIFSENLEDEALWAARDAARTDLIGEVRERTGVALDPGLPIIGFARRMTAYKRANLLFSDLDRLRAVAARFPFQIVLAGKAHVKDLAGQTLIQEIVAHAKALKREVKIAFVPNYEMAIAAKLVAGCDVWLNNPSPPLEASGTSGMKAGLNGVLNFSVLDGWWLEGWQEGITGWAIDPPGAGIGPDRHAAALYDKLERTILPLYQHDKAGWARMMKASIGKVGTLFNSHRMMRRYAAEVYLG